MRKYREMKTKSNTVKNTTKKQSSQSLVSDVPKTSIVKQASLPWYSVYLPFHFVTIIHNTLHFHFWKTLMVLSLPLSLVFGAQSIQFIYPYTQTYREDIISLIKNVYPEELIITIDNGIVSTNVEEPYEISPSVFDPNDKNFVVIDT